MNQTPHSPDRGPGSAPGGNRFRHTSQADRPSRLVLFGRRHKHMLRIVGGMGLCVAGGVAFLALHGTQTILTPLKTRVEAEIPLKVTAIRVEGQNLTSADSIRTALGIGVGDPMLGFDVTAARKRLDDLPFVDHASVERHLSGLIVVRLVERPPFAVWQHKGHFVLIDRDGNPVPDKGMTGKDARAFMQLPLVVGDGADHAAASFLDVVARVQDVSSRMTAATLIAGRRWSISLRDGTVVLLPEAEEVPALNRLVELQKRFGLLDRPVELIDLRLPDRLTIRERPAPVETPAAETGAGGAHGPHSPDNPAENTPADSRNVSHSGEAGMESGAITRQDAPIEGGDMHKEKLKPVTPQRPDDHAAMTEGGVPA